MKKNRIQEKSSDFDFSTFRQEVIQGMIEGKGLTGEGGYVLHRRYVYRRLLKKNPPAIVSLFR